MNQYPLTLAIYAAWGLPLDYPTFPDTHAMKQKNKAHQVTDAPQGKR